MKLADLRKDETKDMVDVTASVDAQHFGVIQKAGINSERVIRAAFEEVHAKLLKEKQPVEMAVQDEVDGVADLKESVAKKEAILAALEKPLAEKGPLGRPTATFDVDLAKKLRAQGLSLAKVAKRVGVSYSTLRRSFAGTRFNQRKRKSRAVKPKTKYAKSQVVQSQVPKKLRNQAKRWTAELLSELAEFYHEPSNHYKSGMVRGDKLGQFARSIGKTPQAVGVKMSEIGLSKTKVVGSRRKWSTDTVKPSKQVFTRNRFPQLPIAVDVDVVKKTVKDMINGRELRQIDMMVVGIDSDDAWVHFVQEFALKAAKIAEYFHVPERFYISRSNKGGIEYANICYRQGKFGVKS